MVTPNRYRNLRVLGRGGFGTVYRAELHGPGGFTKLVAIKVINPKTEVSEDLELRLRDEARMLGLLRHRSVVSVDNLTTLKNGAWAVIMEYVEGIDLSRILIAQEPVPPLVVLEIIAEVASALHAAYALPSSQTGKPLRLVHRDIKPSNIRLTAQGEVKVLDFGVARAELVDREAGSGSYVVGSLKYMSPERVRKKDGPEGDIYALGMVMAELLLARPLPQPPYDADNQPRYVQEITNQAWTRLRSLAPDVTDKINYQLIDLLSACLSFDAATRPTARRLEEQCRALVNQYYGVTLRPWAEQVVPRLMGNGVNTILDTPTSERSLIEITPSAGIPLLMDSEIPVRAPRPLAPPSVAPPIAAPPIPVAPVSVMPAPARPPQRLSPKRVLIGLGTIVLVVVLAWLRPRPSVEAPDAPQEADPSVWVVNGEPSVRTSQPTPAEAAKPASARPVEKQVRTNEKPPTAPVAAPEAAPAVTPEPAPVQVAAAQVRVEGDKPELWLEGTGGRQDPGTVRPGTYTIKARFVDKTFQVIGTYTLEPGEVLTLRCSQKMTTCKAVK